MSQSKKTLCNLSVPSIGLGCMNLSHAYGNPPTLEQGKAILERAYELGVVHFDTAALYGFGKNEQLLGEVIKPFRQQIFLASKCGMTGVDGKRVIDGRAQTIKTTCENSLRSLQTDVIDLYYLHRWDKNVPIEESIDALADLVKDGKIKAIGLSEVSASTLKKAQAVHPIAAVQSEYSLWSRNVELALLSTCAELDVAFVGFSPLARGFLADLSLNPANFVEKDIRNGMPRFQSAHFTHNATLRAEYHCIAKSVGCSAAQLALAWVLQQQSQTESSPQIHVIPGTTSLAHLEENIAAENIQLDTNTMKQLDVLINQNTVHGTRYNVPTQAEIDTEEYA